MIVPPVPGTNPMLLLAGVVMEKLCCTIGRASVIGTPGGGGTISDPPTSNV